jgi:hypothetical protein
MEDPDLEDESERTDYCGNWSRRTNEGITQERRRYTETLDEYAEFGKDVNIVEEIFSI